MGAIVVAAAKLSPALSGAGQTTPVVAVGVGVRVGVGVGGRVGRGPVGVGVGVKVRVAVAVAVGVRVGVCVGPGLCVHVGVGVGVADVVDLAAGPRVLDGVHRAGAVGHGDLAPVRAALGRARRLDVRDVVRDDVDAEPFRGEARGRYVDRAEESHAFLSLT